MTPLTLSAPAKLNLFLHITGQRADGYHELQTIFQLLDYGDTLTFTPKSQGQASLTCNNPDLTGEDNLILKAVRLLEAHCGKALPVDIHLKKVLPMGGGIGGGSSDCATTLLAMNYLFELKLTNDQLIELGSTLGADVPVFVKGQTAWAEGIGEKLTPIEVPVKSYVVLHPDVHVSTPELFRHRELTRNTPISKIRPALANEGHNDFEPLVRKLYPDIEGAFKAAMPFGLARLTGTGACLFLEASDNEDARNKLNAIQADNPTISGFIAQGIQTSPVFGQLTP